MIPLTVHLLVGNNRATISRAIDSILSLEGSILIADAGSRDGSIDICQDYKLPIIKVSSNEDRSKTRNNIIARTKTNWQLFLEPWEVILDGHNEIKSRVQEDQLLNYHCEVMDADVIGKEVRLWRKDKSKIFVNPVFESIKDDRSEYLPVIIWSNRENNPDNSAMLEKWKKIDPLCPDPYYFQAMKALSSKKYKDFLTISDYYLFHRRKPTIATTMIRYYTGVVHCCVTNDLHTAIRNTMMCIAEHPLMAEFWCLLGDIFLQSKEFKKATVFYENAKLLGSRRLRSDRWPMQISKYDDYPSEMISKCTEKVGQAVKLVVQ